MDKIRLGRYRHFKGNEYLVLAVATHSETLEPMVVYQALYGARGIWVRPAAMWNETVLVEGRATPRFVFLGDEKTCTL
ncbi:MAG: DUF1653 domain-containing protein [Clostridiales bacterium]|nr:DUF1653 domain-containing protein [Clostridiales bacterium]